MMLLILISIPLLKGDTWFNNVTSYEMGLNELAYFANLNLSEFNAVLPKYIDIMTQKPKPLIYFTIDINSSCCEFPTNFPTYSSIKNLDSYRSSDVLIYTAGIGDTQKNVTVVFDQTPALILEAQLSIGRTLFVCILLIVVTLLFTRDV